MYEVEKGDLWVADRNFCTVDFVCGIAGKVAHLIFRQHGNLPFTLVGKERRVGKTETGIVYEQSIIVKDNFGEEHQFKRIRVYLSESIRDGDKDIFIITNLPKTAADARNIADIYRGRWTIETSLQELTLWFNSEINTLGYPSAALFAFCVALISYMILSVIKAALCNVHGTRRIETELSGYYVADEISGAYRGMMIAIEAEEWYVFRDLSDAQFMKR